MLLLYIILYFVEDATSLVFMSEEEFQGFDGTEIKKLSQKKTALAEEKLRLQQTVSQTARRIAKLERLLKQNTGKLKEDSTGAKKVYNTYEVIYLQELTVRELPEIFMIPLSRG